MPPNITVMKHSYINLLYKLKFFTKNIYIEYNCFASELRLVFVDYVTLLCPFKTGTFSGPPGILVNCVQFHFVPKLKIPSRSMF